MKSLHNKILLVDDSRDTCEMMTLLLGFADYQVKSANTMTEGWRMAQSGDFDLCLLDGRLPDGSGYELCRQICTLSPDLPVVFYSGDAYDLHRQKGLAAGARAYLIKPNDLEKIAGVFDRLLLEFV